MNRIRYEERYAKILVNALIHYYITKKSKNLNVDFDFTKDELIIDASGKIMLENLDLEELTLLNNATSIPEYQDYYDELSGVGDTSCDSANIDIIASIVDYAKYSYEDNILTIRLIKNIS